VYCEAFARREKEARQISWCSILSLKRKERLAKGLEVRESLIKEGK